MNEHYAITGNNKTPEWLLNCFQNADISYGIGVEETAPTTGTKHMQAYVQYLSRKRITTVMQQFPQCHITSCRGSSDDNVDYVRKTLDSVSIVDAPESNAAPQAPTPPMVEVGQCRYIEKKQQGKRVDLKMWTDRIMAGEVKVRWIMLNEPMLYHQYGRLFRDVEDVYQENARRPEVMPDCLWIWGPTGTGKTYKANQLADDDTYWWSSDNGWWDNYNGQKTIIFNEFRGNIPFAKMLDICDMYVCKLSRRGRGPVSCLANRIIVTSAMPPEECYPNLAGEDKIDQLLRRFRFEKLSVPYGTQEK